MKPLVAVAAFLFGAVACKGAQPHQEEEQACQAGDVATQIQDDEGVCRASALAHLNPNLSAAAGCAGTPPLSTAVAPPQLLLRPRHHSSREMWSVVEEVQSRPVPSTSCDVHQLCLTVVRSCPVDASARAARSAACCAAVMAIIDAPDTLCLCKIQFDWDFLASLLDVGMLWEAYGTCGGRQRVTPRDTDENCTVQDAPPPPPPPKPPVPPSAPAEHDFWELLKENPGAAAVGIGAGAVLIVVSGVLIRDAVLRWRSAGVAAAVPPPQQQQHVPPARVQLRDMSAPLPPPALPDLPSPPRHRPVRGASGDDKEGSRAAILA